ncbi:MAG: nucleoside transporter C-terminal domain-containing protein [Candidatus Sericytochromatia bacterium]|nr:nucleoside transporter C-terminal domain-containing protein [Candidatus Sericytochromatia bacterium]
MPIQLVSVCGIGLLVAIAWLLSTSRRDIAWKTVGVGFAIQFALALFILKFPWGQWLFQKAGAGVTALLDFSKQGAGFVFGKLMDTSSFGFIFAFQVLPTIVFMASVISVLYYLGVVQRMVAALAWVMRKLMGTSGPESLSAAACVFVGQVEGPLLVRPYIASMSRSELMALMTGGMATIAGGVMAAYIGLLGGQWAPALLAASLMGAPGGLAMAKLIVPETEKTAAAGGDSVATLHVVSQESSVIEAAAKGASDGMHLAFTVAAMLLAFVSLVAMLNGGLALLGGFVGHPTMSLEKILGWAFFPLALALGAPWADASAVAHMIGTKLVLNEFLSYAALADTVKNHTMSDRGVMIATFALCGFANLSSVAQNVGGIGSMAPERRGDLARLGPRAMLAGALASCMSAAMAGVLIP